MHGIVVRLINHKLHHQKGVIFFTWLCCCFDCTQFVVNNISCFSHMVDTLLHSLWVMMEGIHSNVHYPLLLLLIGGGLVSKKTSTIKFYFLNTRSSKEYTPPHCEDYRREIIYFKTIFLIFHIDAL